jgi:protein-S-isoprenylcysteine O-methyltransferase Ste14
MICSVYMGVAFFNFVLYRWLPLSVDPLPLRFPWQYSLSITIALIIGIPATSLMIVAIRDAGKETLAPEKVHTLHTGIYESIRHPQALGELSIWYVVALVLDSPFLLFISALYTPLWILWCFLEEKDLVIRYGKSYEEYRLRTGMFIPRLRK